METVHKKGISVGRASVFRHLLCGNASHTFMVDQYANLTPMCKNFTFIAFSKNPEASKIGPKNNGLLSMELDYRATPSTYT